MLEPDPGDPSPRSLDHELPLGALGFLAGVARSLLALAFVRVEGSRNGLAAIGSRFGLLLLR